jgi:hypothetical protein
MQARIRKEGSCAFVWHRIVLRSLWSSAILTPLPFLLIEFPLVYATVRRMLGYPDGNANSSRASNNNRLSGSHGEGVSTGGRRCGGCPRAPVLHVACTSLLSTLVFLAEPKARLEIIVVYTWWRVLEALCGQFGFRFNVTTAHKPPAATRATNARADATTPSMTTAAMKTAQIASAASVGSYRRETLFAALLCGAAVATA